MFPTSSLISVLPDELSISRLIADVALAFRWRKMALFFDAKQDVFVMDAVAASAFEMKEEATSRPLTVFYQRVMGSDKKAAETALQLLKVSTPTFDGKRTRMEGS